MHIYTYIKVPRRHASRTRVGGSCAEKESGKQREGVLRQKKQREGVLRQKRNRLHTQSHDQKKKKNVRAQAAHALKINRKTEGSPGG